MLIDHEIKTATTTTLIAGGRDLTLFGYLAAQSNFGYQQNRILILNFL